MLAYLDVGASYSLTIHTALKLLILNSPLKRALGKRCEVEKSTGSNDLPPK